MDDQRPAGPAPRLATRVVGADREIAARVAADVSHRRHDAAGALLAAPVEDDAARAEAREVDGRGRALPKTT